MFATAWSETYPWSMLDLDKIREQSGLTISPEGVFHHHGAPVENEKVQVLFSQGVRVREDGRVILRVGPQWCYVAADDTPYVILGLSGLQTEQPQMRLNTGVKEVLDPSTLWVSEDDVLYARVNGGVLARFSRNAFHQLITDFWSAIARGCNYIKNTIWHASFF